MTVYQALYDVLTPKVAPYLTVYPFLDTPLNLVTGSCSFHESRRKNLSSGEKRQLAGGILRISSTMEIEVNISFSRLVNYEDAENGPTEAASKLQAYLKSDEAAELFCSNGFEMAPVWGDILTEGFLTEDKKWAVKAAFDMKFYALNELEVSSEPLKYIVTKIEEI